MKRLGVVLLVLIFLFGCSNSRDATEPICNLRKDLLQRNGCSFIAKITADYTQQLHTFQLRCQSDKDGNIAFEVISPDSIAGITGTLSANAGKLTFDDHALLFSMLADNRISPVSAPWVLIRALRSGYISGCGKEGSGFLAYIDDSYNQDALQVTVRFNSENIVNSAEIFYRGNRILEILVEDFLIL